MTTMTMTNQMATAPGRSLEELVDRVMDALLGEKIAEPAPSVARSVHDARRLRRAGDLDGALAVLGGVDTGRATEKEARWAFSEWMGSPAGGTPAQAPWSTARARDVLRR